MSNGVVAPSVCLSACPSNCFPVNRILQTGNRLDVDNLVIAKWVTSANGGDEKQNHLSNGILENRSSVVSSLVRLTFICQDSGGHAMNRKNCVNMSIITFLIHKEF